MELLEKLKVSDGMGAWIDDFKKSDAPQFKGKNEKEKRDMAIAAYLSAKKEGYVSYAQQKAVWAARKDGGKGHPDNKKKNESVPYRKGTHDSGDDAGDAPGKTVYNYKTKKVEFQPYKKMKKESVDEVKMVPGFVRHDGTRTSKPTKHELGKTPEYHAIKKRLGKESSWDGGDPSDATPKSQLEKERAERLRKMKKNTKSEADAPFKGSYTKNPKPISFKQARAKVKKLAQKGMSGMKSEALQPGHHKVEIDHMGGRDSVAKKHGVTITKAKGSNPYAHHATGPKAGLQKYLKHHYDGDHEEAKANHPDVYK